MLDFALKHTTDEIDRRLRNPFWGGLILGWITWNWRVWYLTFFVSESLVGNKIAEIQRMYEYFGWHPLPGIILNWVIIPVFIAYCAIFLFPKLTDQFLKKQKKNKENEDIILRADLSSEEENVKASTKLLEAEKIRFETEIEKLRAEMEVETNKRALAIAEEQIQKSHTSLDSNEQNGWDQEYTQLISKNTLLIDKLTELIYKYGGLDYQYNDINYKKIFEVNELVSRTYDDNNNQVYILTEKGKYFLKKDSLEPIF